MAGEFCEDCGAELTVGKKFCGHCGSRTASAATATRNENAATDSAAPSFEAKNSERTRPSWLLVIAATLFVCAAIGLLLSIVSTNVRVNRLEADREQLVGSWNCTLEDDGEVVLHLNPGGSYWAEDCPDIPPGQGTYRLVNEGKDSVEFINEAGGMNVLAYYFHNEGETVHLGGTIYHKSD